MLPTCHTPPYPTHASGALQSTLSANYNAFVNGTSVAQVVSGVRSASVRTASRFLEDTILGKTYSTVRVAGFILGLLLVAVLLLSPLPGVGPQL